MGQGSAGKSKIPCSKLQGIFDRKGCGLFYDSFAFAIQY